MLLIFVVPDDVHHNFKQQPYTNKDGSNLKTATAHRIEQCVPVRRLSNTNIPETDDAWDA